MTVYFAWAVRARRIKIGCVKRHVLRRLIVLERQMRQPFVLLATCPGGRRVEGYYHRRHRRFVARRRTMNGGQRKTEYFRPHPKLIADIFELRLINGPPKCEPTHAGRGAQP